MGLACVHACECVCAWREREREKGNDQNTAALIYDKSKRPTETQEAIAAHSRGARKPDAGGFNTSGPPYPPLIPKLSH